MDESQTASLDCLPPMYRALPVIETFLSGLLNFFTAKSDFRQCHNWWTRSTQTW